MKPAPRLFILLLSVSLLFLAGCLQSPYYQKDVSVPQYSWNYNFQPSFRFEIRDTAALYNLYFIVRHTDTYQFSNIWLNVKTKLPADSNVLQQRVEIPLAEQSGKWLGRGMGEIFDQRHILASNWKFKKAGLCEIRIAQDMRINPLTEVLQVGLRVEKVGYKKH